MDAVFRALSSPSRRRMLDIVRNQQGCCVNDVCAHFAISRIAVMKHLKILQEANLIISVKEGRTRRLYFNVLPVQEIHDHWAEQFADWWDRP